MAFFRRVFTLAVGAAVGCAATLALQQYRRDQEQAEHLHTEGPAQQPAEAPDTAPAPEEYIPVHRNAPSPERPNANPVVDATEKPPVVDGKVDVTRIADPADFADWEDYGCRG